MVEALKGESDRGAIILASTMIDDRLRWAIEQKITTLNSDEMARFFRHDAGSRAPFPNASFSPKPSALSTERRESTSTLSEKCEMPRPTRQTNFLLLVPKLSPR
jgi:hypothetical protein